MEKLKERVTQFSQERNWVQYHTPKNLVMALSVEVAELMEHFMWATPEQSASLPPEKLQEVADEVGDVMLYLVNFCSRLGIDPVAAAHQKLDKVERRYPVESSKG